MTPPQADRIRVLRKCRIVEPGSQLELLARDGLYAHIFRTQRPDPE